MHSELGAFVLMLLLCCHPRLRLHGTKICQTCWCRVAELTAQNAAKMQFQHKIRRAKASKNNIKSKTHPHQTQKASTTRGKRTVQSKREEEEEQ